MTIVFAIDQSSDSSGWCLMRDGRIVDSSVALTAVDREDACDAAHTLMMSADDAVIVVFEDHRKFHIKRGNMSVASLQGMGAARGRWEQCLELRRFKDVRFVAPTVWRKEVLGLSARVTGETAKRTAMNYAHALLGRPAGDDESEAICIAAWAARNCEPKKTRKRKAG